ncbi:hypothetical protein [Bacillus sp. JCM 19034]|uniref:hypothetical protein n=1 Tax=Bacillus sp. JCM 19034 TaxID=1481928 RepID=UPI0007815FA0|nr:hypothetical protein [Bacillus sp. JCM 19034]
MLIDLLKEQYNWVEGRFIDNDLIETDKGLKRIRYWSDKQLLDWHINWRDHCSDTPYLLVDRMLRTKEQQPFVSFEGAYVTVHDEIVEPFLIKGQESAVASALATFIHYGLKVESNREQHSSTHLEKELFTADHMFLETEGLTDYHFYRKEAIRREEKAAALLQTTKSTRLPTLDPILSVKQVRTTANVLYWVGTMDEPIKGYVGLDQFFREMFLQVGESSSRKLIEHLIEKLDRNQAIQLLAEIVKPNEWNNWSQHVALDNSRLAESFQRMQEQWEITKQLVQIISMTIDKKKVSIS